jgi:imidazolonepropionase-like amidohydrolase
VTENNLPKEGVYKNLRISGCRIPGIEGKRFDINIHEGRFASVTEVPRAGPAGSSREDIWITPGIIDLHVHLGWTDFFPADQEKRREAEIETLRLRALDATLRGGITTVRDAGGLPPDAVRHLLKRYGHPLRIYPCGAVFGAEDAQGCSYLERQVQKSIDTGAGWIKLFATGGIGTPPEKVLDPLFSREEFFTIVRSARRGKVQVMVHTWGGPAMDWAIEAGVDSVEHGIYLNREQARGLAAAKIPLVPTAAIYRIAADPKGAFVLDGTWGARAAQAAGAHPQAVCRAKEAGVSIGFGTDFAASLHGHNLEEIGALIDCGLTVKEAWSAATETAAAILGCDGTLGRIAEGFTADAVLFNTDPYAVQNVKILRKSIRSVIAATDAGVYVEHQ